MSNKLNHSQFLITIQTNKDYNSCPENFIDKFRSVIKEVFYTDQGFVNIMSDLNNKDGINPKTIESIELTYTIEKGDLQNRVHSHIFYNITHRTKLKVDKVALTKEINEKLGITNCYIHIDIVPYRKNDEANIIHYFNKTSSK
jgi:hypothetical protein